jgi:hypothetical protein
MSQSAGWKTMSVILWDPAIPQADARPLCAADVIHRQYCTQNLKPRHTTAPGRCLGRLLRWPLLCFLLPLLCSPGAADALPTIGELNVLLPGATCPLPAALPLPGAAAGLSNLCRMLAGRLCTTCRRQAMLTRDNGVLFVLLRH